MFVPSLMLLRTCFQMLACGRSTAFTHSVALRARPHPFLTDPPLPASAFAALAITGGYARTKQGFTITWPLRKPMYIEPSLRLNSRGARPACDPVDSDSRAKFSWSPPKIETKLAKVLDVSPHSGADGHVQGEPQPSR